MTTWRVGEGTDAPPEGARRWCVGDEVFWADSVGVWRGRVATVFNLPPVDGGVWTVYTTTCAGAVVQWADGERDGRWYDADDLHADAAGALADAMNATLDWIGDIQGTLEGARERLRTIQCAYLGGGAR